MWTGDSIGHDIHNISPVEVTDNIQILSNLLKSYFPNTPIIPALGNHDFYPVNIQKFNVSNSEHLHNIGETWRLFIDNEDAI